MGALLGLLPNILKTVGGILGIGVLKDAGEALSSAQISPEQQVALQTALLQHQEALAQVSLEQFKAAMSESLAEIQSPDKYVSRARPTGLYIFYLVSGAIAIAMLFGVKIDPTAVLTILGPLGGVGGVYVYKRTQEKIAGASANGTNG